MTTPLPTGDALLEDACERSGLDDFGPGDFRDGLAVLLDSLERDGELSEAAAVGVLDDFRRRLANRLEVESWYRDYPATDPLGVRGPVDISGLPRTGTTALANMLSLDPQFRCLRRWEQAKPCPPPEPATDADDPRRADGARVVASFRGIKAKHIFELDATSEDLELLGMAFHGPQFTLPVRRYHEWWRTCDMSPTYRYHRRVVELLGSRQPPARWLFKAPHHTFHLEAIVAAYPDVRFVMTHRDPVRSVPSWVSIVASVLPAPEDGRDLQRLGRECSEHLRVGVERAMAARARLGDDRFLDVHHRELLADPMGTVRQVYAWLDLELTPDTASAISAWQERNRSGAHGTHRYTAAEYGLSDAQLRADFEEYVRHFDVDVEVDV